LIDWFFPAFKAGGPVQSCFNFSMALKEKFDIYVITTDSDLGESAALTGVTSNQWTNLIDKDVKVYYFSRSALNYKSLKSVISNVAPDFIYLNHLFSFYFVILPLYMWWVGAIRSKVVLCPRGALFDSALHHQRTFLKKLIFLKILRWLGVYRNILFQATNNSEKRAIQRFFPTEKVTVIDNLPNNRQSILTCPQKRKGELRAVYVARIVPLKNLLFILQIIQTISVSIELTIVGPVEDQEYWKACQERIKQLPQNVKVFYKGALANKDILLVLESSHLYVLPSAGENFGHSIFESFLIGRPVLISDQTPWRNLEEKGAGWDIALEKRDSYRMAFENASEWSQEEFNDRCHRAWELAHNFITTSSDLRKYEQLFS